MVGRLRGDAALHTAAPCHRGSPSIMSRGLPGSMPVGGPVADAPKDAVQEEASPIDVLHALSTLGKSVGDLFGKESREKQEKLKREQAVREVHAVQAEAKAERAAAHALD